MDDHPVVRSLQEMLELNDRCLEYPGAFDLVRVQLNDGTSIMGFVLCFDSQHPDEFLFQEGILAEVDMSMPLFFHLVPRLKSNGTEPRWIRFGERQGEAQSLVCSSWMKRVVEHFERS